MPSVCYFSHSPITFQISCNFQSTLALNKSLLYTHSDNNLLFLHNYNVQCISQIILFTKYFFQCCRKPFLQLTASLRVGECSCPPDLCLTRNSDVCRKSVLIGGTSAGNRGSMKVVQRRWWSMKNCCKERQMFKLTNWYVNLWMPKITFTNILNKVTYCSLLQNQPLHTASSTTFLFHCTLWVG